MQGNSVVIISFGILMLYWKSVLLETAQFPPSLGLRLVPLYFVQLLIISCLQDFVVVHVNNAVSVFDYSNDF